MLQVLWSSWGEQLAATTSPIGGTNDEREDLIVNVNVNGKPFTALPPGVLETIWEYGPSPVLRWIDSGLRQLIQFKVFYLHAGCHLAIRGRFLWLTMLSLWNGCCQRGRVETDLPFILDGWIAVAGVCERRAALPLSHGDWSAHGGVQEFQWSYVSQ